jgi:DNA primase
LEGKLFYSEDVVSEVMARSDIVDVIGSYVSLRRKGNNYEACCPFHHEKTPSFKVSKDKQMYHCFGCGVGGNVFTFVMEYENLNFPETIERLAERAGMQLPEKSMTSAERGREQYKITLREMNKSAAAYFHYIMKNGKNGKRAYDYFHDRGLTDETINKFGLGYADIYKDDLYRYLRGKGYTDQQLKDSGLVSISERDGGVDKFWNRAMIPILDINGKVIAFGGRVLGDGKPKYINTSDTAVFDKSHTLFAMNIARRSRRKGFICCEGYMDVISMHQAGFDNAVASLGTAFTFGHANIIKRYADEVYLAYDSDGAGVAATKKVIAILREVGVATRVINMRPYKDPDEFIQNMGKEAFEERIEKSESAMMFLARIYSEEYNQKDPAERTKFQNQVAKELSYITDVLERNNYVEAVAATYGIDKEALAQKVHEYGVAGIPKPEVVEREERRLEEQRRGERQSRSYVQNGGQNSGRTGGQPDSEDAYYAQQATLSSYEQEADAYYDQNLYGYDNGAGPDNNHGPAGTATSQNYEAMKLLLTWLVNKPVLFSKLEGVISAEDFQEGIFRNVAEKLFSQYEKNHKVEPALIVSNFQDVEEQRLVAGMMQTDLAVDMDDDEVSAAITDVVKKIKLSSIKTKLDNEYDMTKIQELIKARKNIERFKLLL